MAADLGGRRRASLVAPAPRSGDRYAGPVGSTPNVTQHSANSPYNGRVRYLRCYRPAWPGGVAGAGGPWEAGGGPEADGLATAPRRIYCPTTLLNPQSRRRGRT